MKKILALMLITFAFALSQLALPTNPVAVDNDVGIYSFISADQIQPMIVADNSSPVYLSDYAVPVCPDVGIAVCINNITISQEILWQNNESTIERVNAKNNQASKVEGLLRTDTGDTYPWDGAKSRHI